MQPKVNNELQELNLKESRDTTNKSLDILLALFLVKHPEEMRNLQKKRGERLAFHGFPLVHWASIRILNPIESSFITVKIRKPKCEEL